MTNIKPWETIDSTVALGEKWFRVRKDKVRLPLGTIIDDYFVWEAPDIATVVPYTSDGNFVLCKQYRHGIGKVVYQFPAGHVETSEDPIETAKRELKEEVGYDSNSVTPLSAISLYPTNSTGWSHLFLAQDAYPIGETNYDESEEAEVVLVSPLELEDLLSKGEMPVASSFAAGLLALKALNL